MALAGVVPFFLSSFEERSLRWHAESRKTKELEGGVAEALVALEERREQCEIWDAVC